MSFPEQNELADELIRVRTEARNGARAMYEQIATTLADSKDATEMLDEAGASHYEAFVRPALIDEYLRELARLCNDGANGWSAILVGNWHDAYVGDNPW